MCCKHLRLEHEDYASPAGEWCKHSTEEGCAIYENRFEMCQDYYCAWLQGYFLEPFRPDKCKLIATHCAVKDPLSEEWFEYWHCIEEYHGGHTLSRAGLIMRALDRDTLPIMVTCTQTRKSVLYRPRAMLTKGDPELEKRWLKWQDLMRDAYER